jgi:hypothetical protein
VRWRSAARFDIFCRVHPGTALSKGLQFTRAALVVGTVTIAAVGVRCVHSPHAFSCDEHLAGVPIKTCWEWPGLSSELERWHRGLCQGRWGHGCPRSDALGACTGGGGTQIWYYPNPEAKLFTSADVKRTLCDRNGSTFLTP